MQSASDRNFYQSYNPPSDLISEFKAPQDSIRSRVTQYLPPTTSIPSISKSSPSNVIKFLIPEGGAIDTKTIRLHMNISVTVPDITGATAGWIRLDNAGWGAMIDSINVYESGQIIEQVNRASIVSAMLNQLCPEDYQEGVLSITEKTQYYENPDTTLYPVGCAGGKTLIVFGGNTDVTATSDTPTVTCKFSCSLNLPVGIFNTNR